MQRIFVMSLPRPILPGTTYLITRRCFQRQFLLRPSKLVNDTVLYCLATAAQKYGVLVHACCFLSNHYHLVVTDPSATLPAFVHWLDEFVAKALNTFYGRWESFWAPGSYSAVRLETDDAVVEKMAYVLANPVRAGLVRTAREWPGLCCGPSACDSSFEATRPAHFFRPNGSTPATSTLRLVRPPCLAQMSDEEFTTMLDRAITQSEDEVRRATRCFVGRAAILAQSPTDCPRTWKQRRQLNPRIACRDKWRRIEALQRLKAFLAAYREAWRRFRTGARDVVFPLGTYALRVHQGVACA